MRLLNPAICCRLATALLLASPLAAQQSTPAPAPTAPTLNRRAETPADPQTNPQAYVAAQFGPSFKLDPKVPPMVGDVDGDGRPDLVLVATSTSPLRDEAAYHYKTVDPYDAYYGTGNTRITSQFSLHFDGSERSLLVVLNPAKPDPKKVYKYVIINTPFETVSLVDFRFKKQYLKAIETIDRTTLHALIFWTRRGWVWAAQGMDAIDDIPMPPSDQTKMPPPR